MHRAPDVVTQVCFFLERIGRLIPLQATRRDARPPMHGHSAVVCLSLPRSYARLVQSRFFVIYLTNDALLITPLLEYIAPHRIA